MAPLQIALGAKAEFAGFADDQVIVQGDAKDLSGILNLGGHADVGIGG